MDKVIFHIDVNSAFLSWEAVYRLTQGKGITADEDICELSREFTDSKGNTIDLRDIPSAVGGDMASRHGVILAKSIPAKKYNVKTGESIVEAVRKCPCLLVVKPHHHIYRQYSEKFIGILKEYSPDVEQVSVDEAFVDMTGTELLFGRPIEAAHKIKDRIREELGFTVNVGISNNKLLAKMASDFKKPDLVHTLFPDEIRTKMWKLPVSELYFVGKATAKKLSSMGIVTIGDLAKADVNILKMQLKKQGEIIWNFANGIDFTVVQSEPSKNKGYGNSTTLSFDVEDACTAKHILLSLAENVSSRLRHDNVKISLVSVGIKDNTFKTTSHQKVLASPTDITNEIHQAACELFDEMWTGTPIRLLGIQTSKIDEGGYGRQMNLFDNTDYEKLEKLDNAVDKIREKYGKDKIKRATFLE